MAARPEAVACIDIGKTNRRLALVALADGALLDMVAEPSAPDRSGPYPALDLGGAWDFVRRALRRFAAAAEVRRIVTAAHGAAFVALAGDAPALPALDYEHDGPDRIEPDYAPLRPPFSESFSPPLPGGLNAGRGLYWLSRAYPEPFARADAIVALAQYLGFRLSGARASEPTSLGAHTDLWAPLARGFSSLVGRLGWGRLTPPLVRAGDTLGPVRAAVAAETLLPADCEVLAGVHDSNATLAPHLDAAAGGPARTVLSTGTWIIAFAPGGRPDRLDPARDCLANVDILGRPVPSSRFMGGREFEILTGGAAAGGGDRGGVLARGAIPLPGFVPRTGPFGGRAGTLPEGWAAMAAADRAEAASLYAAFVAAEQIALTGGAGEVLVEGVFARNAGFLTALAAVLDRPVLAGADATGTLEGLKLLAGAPASPPAATPVPAPDPALADAIRRAHGDWRGRSG